MSAVFWMKLQQFNVKSFLKRQRLFFRGAMIKKRNFNGKAYSFADLTGHGAFVFLAISYLETDITNLRLYAASGISLSILFQYYRAIPLWLPIKWNFFFLGSNIWLLGMLYKESSDADNLPLEQKQFYASLFGEADLPMVDFLHVMMIANRREYQKGDVVVGCGDKRRKLHLIHSGKCSIHKDDDVIGSLITNQFVSEQSFTTWRVKVGDKINHSKYNANKEYIFKQLKLTSEEENEKESSAEWLSGKADVICEEPAVIYSWDFAMLHEMMHFRPNVAMAFERLISYDMNVKMDQNSSLDAVKMYKQRLTGALMGDIVTQLKKRHLEKFRVENNVSLEVHQKLIEKLDWSVEEYDAGCRGAYREVLNQYTDLLEILLGDQDEISLKDKFELRRFRTVHNITGNDQILSLAKFGWSQDEYEQGYKGPFDENRGRPEPVIVKEFIEVEKPPPILPDPPTSKWNSFMTKVGTGHYLSKMGSGHFVQKFLASGDSGRASNAKPLRNAGNIWDEDVVNNCDIRRSSNRSSAADNKVVVHADGAVDTSNAAIHIKGEEQRMCD